ncbi:hypothetical protein KIL84_001611 [Mauremys mutica]|uniref:Uncharacterized protein n=1 Tax=Mauremys mutica TaxID=74926 RepID=A0A9D3XJ92_9SAUR|nr:hypothetical protein KIL84_001611 [Mauremys mutica]
MPATQTRSNSVPVHNTSWAQDARPRPGPSRHRETQFTPFPSVLHTWPAWQLPWSGGCCVGRAGITQQSHCNFPKHLLDKRQFSVVSGQILQSDSVLQNLG